jgi:hypothetical protein
MDPSGKLLRRRSIVEIETHIFGPSMMAESRGCPDQPVPPPLSAIAHSRCHSGVATKYFYAAATGKPIRKSVGRGVQRQVWNEVAPEEVFT